MRKTKQLIVALDIGTSSTRALLYDTAGNLLPGREVKAEYKQHLTSDGGVECDPDHLLSQTLGALKQLMRLAAKEEKSRIAAVGASCFWHAIMGIDSNGNAATPLYSWADTRAHVAVPGLLEKFESAKYHDQTGAFIHPCFWPAKIAWLQSTNPELASKVAKWISFPDYLALKLSGESNTSISIASATGLMNRETSKWDDDILGKLSLSQSQLPEIAGDNATFKITSTKPISGLPDVPWFFAFGDGACSNIGAGGTSDKRLVINISTSGAARFLCENPCCDLPSGLFGYRLDTTRHVIGGAISNGGNVYAWLTRSLAMPKEPWLEKALHLAKPASTGLCVLPFWAGERSPGWHASASASILGLGLSTQPAEIAQATLECIAYSIRQVRDMIVTTYPQATDVIVSGGAVESSKYMQQLLADVLDSSVRVSLDAEPSGRGAALAVSEKMGTLKSIEVSKDELSRRIKPRPDAVQAHNAAYGTYVGWYEKMVQ